MMKGLSEIVKQFVDLDLTFEEHVTHQPKGMKDLIHEYACDVLSLGLLLMEFNDSVREGDGDRIFRCWRYFLLLFKASNRTNYAVEAFTLLAQYHYLFSERMAMQLKWSQTINTHGQPGKNIPADLHMEHLNKLCKSALSGLGANITDSSVQRIGRCIGHMQSILDKFDEENGVPDVSDYHTKHSTEVDLKKLIKQLQDAILLGVPTVTFC